MAMIKIAPTSSKIASETKNTFNELGMRCFNIASITSAKAVSVAVDIAYPLKT